MSTSAEQATEQHLVAAAVICRLFEYDERRLRQLAAEGVIPTAQRGKYPLGATIQGLARHLKGLAHRKSETLKQKQEAKLDKELRKLDIEIGEMESSLVSVEEMTTRLSPGLVAMRQVILGAGMQPGDRDALFASLQKILEDCLTSSSGTKAESGK